MVVEDVVYENADADVNHSLPFRRLIFERNKGLVQSEALLTRDGLFDKSVYETEQNNASSSSKSKRKGTQRRNKGNDFFFKIFGSFQYLLFKAW